ncbi:tRNA dihydrouridine(20/20a) synthase DusA [Orenia marismortui]|uniref:tRNA dihydrouridine(20/20a) synthase DusA n=1 Tax=Orenia marismortui TaxID=46469 RepID=UPI00037EBCD5|nr:tRNA dihydrouridine(20/20a) synthase DusA [Orenia marismortui]
MPKYISKIETPKVSIAPMIDRTVRGFRYFIRLITKRSLLYTEMITTHAILHGDRNKILDFDLSERPIALQIAGSDPKEIYEAVKVAEKWDYDEINLNVGCPSNRVSGHMMGAVLMAYPELVAKMVKAMRRATDKAVTVKHRIGIDGTGILPKDFKKVHFDQYKDMQEFIKIVEGSKVDRFTVHARIAILAGLSAKENRKIPPLRYNEVYRLKKEFPHLKIEINGGINTIREIEDHLKYVDGVMLGRVAYDNPFILAKVDQFFEKGKINNISRREIIEEMISYVEQVEAEDRSEYETLRHTLGLFYGKAGSKQWRQLITPPWPTGYSGKDILEYALEVLPEESLDERSI